jgi:hypothetical protein
MTWFEFFLGAWDEAHRELAIALDGTLDEDVWKRADPRLLSVGEIVGHAVTWEAKMSVSPAELGLEEGSTATITSPLIDERFRYYTDQVGGPVVLSMTAPELTAEVARVHGIAKTRLIEMQPEPDAKVPWSPNWNWTSQLQYRVFHTAYHTGQVYTVRHLLGHTPEDN